MQQERKNLPLYCFVHQVYLECKVGGHQQPHCDRDDRQGASFAAGG